MSHLGIIAIACLASLAVFGFVRFQMHRQPTPDRALDSRPYQPPGLRRLVTDLLRPPSFTERVSREILDRSKRR